LLAKDRRAPGARFPIHAQASNNPDYITANDLVFPRNMVSDKRRPSPAGATFIPFAILHGCHLRQIRRAKISDMFSLLAPVAIELNGRSIVEAFFDSLSMSGVTKAVHQFH
jgi:hypothetical protein